MKLHQFANLSQGTTAIWYMRTNMFCDVSINAFLGKKSVTMATLNTSHICLGTIGETDINKLYMMMQGDVWSPNGEAFGFIDHLGLSHTSLSIGDVVVINNKGFQCVKGGWDPLENSTEDEAQ
jgi:hypothetical protein